MIEPKQLYDITIQDLQTHRWCYFYDDEGRYDVFEYVIPDTHPKFDANVMELELATFQFRDGQEYFGMYDGSMSYTMWVGGEWVSLWYGVRRPPSEDIARARQLLEKSNLRFPVLATAVWSKKSKHFKRIQYSDQNSEIVEIDLSSA